ncbi:flagellar hook-length control protein FliK [Herbinix luporum]|jgi:flagellar hook-length control protein FliK|uniref:flagellar hook-length control protein FliK n=1 Tax=Herbinix luporum TaxID=1679721 RepID=UPI0023F41D01|nr:flagellar hook-length control protein FliK [Herbinix luporum]MDI9488093.1 flagellar hook-length control protein FliK [Bacillota bacterium]
MVMQKLVAHNFQVTAGSGDFATNGIKTKGNDFDIFLENSMLKEDKKISDSRETPATKETNNPLPKEKQLLDSKEEKITKVQTHKQNKPNKDSVEETAFEGQVLAMFEQIRSAIMEALNLTSEELDQMMEDMGLNTMDLLDPNTIMELVLNKYGATDSTAMLLNEQLADTFKNLLMAVDDIKKDVFQDISHDEIKLMLEDSTDSKSDEEILISDLNTNKTSDSQADKTGEKQEDTNKSQLNNNHNQDETKAVDKLKQDRRMANQLEADQEVASTDGFEVFLDNLSNNYEKPTALFTQDTARLVDIKEIAQEIIESVRVMAKPGQTTMELQLYPEHLGKVNITLTSNNEGLMTAHFVVENKLAKEAVEGQMFTLKENLAEQGIKVENIEVTIAEYSFDQNSQFENDNSMMRKKSNNTNKITFEEAVAMNEETQEAADNNYIAGVMGSNIDYTA